MVDLWTHGTISTYTNKHCRCEDCSMAWSVYQQARYQHHATMVRDYKLAHGCVDCGYNSHPDALHFDHLRDKSFNISTMLKRCSLETIFREIGKCEVVCANCHAVRTSNRRLRTQENLLDREGREV